ncbi:MAG: epimerase [Deltaproteobacteria bacterium RIFOXYD12_FULL_50_9]|nr:MAG: epimerase [Deltaproteobacteria bacterium RIFOXYD12_FULL_50_9]
MHEKRVAVLGATSLVGECLLPLLVRDGWRVMALSRRKIDRKDGSIEWQRLDKESLKPENYQGGESISHCICLAPLWVLSDYLDLFAMLKIRRLVVLSSTSRFTKDTSSDPEEQAVARRLAEAEMLLQTWGESHGVEWVILRPTLIYGLGRDKNIAEIARFIRRFGFFPLCGRASGLRQPIHAQDVATVCLSALQEPAAANRAYNVSGGETLNYCTMVARVFRAMGRSPRLVSIPLFVFRMALVLPQFLPRYRHVTASMAERMNRDLVFDHKEAALDLAFKPRTFVLSEGDVVV